MGRWLIVTTISQVVDGVTVTDERAAHLTAEANITLGGDAKVVSKSIVGSFVKSALTESNASLTSKHHG